MIKMYFDKIIHSRVLQSTFSTNSLSEQIVKYFHRYPTNWYFSHEYALGSAKVRKNHTLVGRHQTVAVSEC